MLLSRDAVELFRVSSVKRPVIRKQFEILGLTSLQAAASRPHTDGAF